MSERSLWQAIVLALLSVFGFGWLPGALLSAQGHSSLVAGPSAAETRAFRVAVQIGHYKNNELPDALARLEGNTGTSGGGRTEIDLNYDVANRVARLLRAQDVIVEVLPATVPTGYSADAFIAIHADGNASSSPRGFKISTRWRSEVARQDASLVERLTEAYSKATGLPEDSNVTRNMRGYYAYSPWRANWRVSNFTPGAIVEMGYMTNPSDRAVMFNRTDSVASGIATGVMSFLKSAYGEQPLRTGHKYGYGLVDDDIDPLATPVPTPRPGTSSGNGSGGPPRTQTGDWQVLLFGKTTVRVYAQAGGGGGVVATLSRGQLLRSTLRQGDYYQVTLPDGKKGWIHRNSIIVQM